MYKISIIVPLNSKNYTKKFFKSILNQSIGFQNLEIIILDNSINNTNQIINEFSEKYENVKLITLDKKIGYPGELYNIGIQNSSAEYIMFLDIDNYLLKDACNILYTNMLDCNFVSCNFNKLINDKKIENKCKYNTKILKINSITDKPELFEVLEMLDTKLFKKDLILKNNIKFPNNIPNYDLIFIYQYILNVNNIKFIDIPIVDCNLSKNKTNFNKTTIAKYIKSYKEMYSLLINTEFNDFALIHLNYLTKDIIYSELTIQDKIDLLMFSKYLYKKFIEKKIYYPNMECFFKLLYKEDYINAIKFSNSLSLNFKDSSNIKNKNIFILFWGLEEKIGGLAKAVCDRSNLLYNNGYSITLLNNDSIKNFKFITEKYYRLGYLNESIKIINIYDYYSKKNTIKFEDKTNDFTENLIRDNNDFIKKINNLDNSITLQYFNSEPNIIKEELYMNGYLALEKVFENNELRYEYYYTPDNFNYFYIDYFSEDFMLFDRYCDLYISFNNLQEFEDYFVTELCLNSSEKPFLINDCSGPTPSIKNISSDIAHKIGVVHNNPYLEPYRYGCPMRNIASLSEFEYEDAVVVLTNSAKNDFIKEFNSDKFVVIPNFIPEDNIKDSSKNFVKQNNVISIFARISPEKNISDIINAFKKVLKKHKNAILKIYGRAMFPYEIEEKDKLERLITDLGISESIKFMGHVDNVYEEMNKSLVTILCSNIEGFCLVILESMINRTPVISYDINYGPKDIITNDVNGFIIKQFDINSLAETIIKVLDNPEKTNKMGILGREHILKNFTEDIVLNKWESLFAKIYLTDSNENYNLS